MLRPFLRKKLPYSIFSKFELLERIWFLLLPSPSLRLRFIRSHHIFAEIGEHIHWQPRKYPTDGDRIKLHNNIAVASGVEFYMHDIINFVLSGKDKTHKYEVYRGCTEIFDNVFIGANSKILYNVKIGPNAIIAAGSVVSKDVPEGSVVGGYLQKL